MLQTIQLTINNRNTINSISNNINQIINVHIMMIDTVGDNIMIIVIVVIMTGVFGVMTTGALSIDGHQEKIARFIKIR